MPSPDDIRSLFQRHGLRCTRQREQVFAALAATHSHPTAEELLQAARLADAGISLATIYNALDAFIEAGLARHVPAHGPARFDADMSPHAHIAIPGGEVVDLPADLSERLLAGIAPETLREVEARLGVKVARVMVQVITQPVAGASAPTPSSSLRA